MQLVDSVGLAVERRDVILQCSLLRTSIPTGSLIHLPSSPWLQIFAVKETVCGQQIYRKFDLIVSLNDILL